MRPGVKSGKQPMRPKPTGTPTVAGATKVNGAAQVAAAAGGGRKKKKKKGKGKSLGSIEAAVTTQHVLDDDDGDLPELEQFRPPGAFMHSRTRLSPDLESVHLSATASLSEAARHGMEHLSANVNGSPAAHTELFAELYRKVGFDAATAVEDEMRKSLDALPGMRNFIRSAIAAMSNDSEEARERKLRSISQQILQSSGIVTQGTVKTNGVSQLDTNALSEIALTHALERLVTGKNTTVSGESGQTTALHTNVVLSHEFLDDEDVVFEDDMYSEDELEERHGGVGHLHTDGSKAYAPGWNINGAVGGVYCELDEAAPPGAYPTEEMFPVERHGIPGKKSKNRRSGREEMMTNPARTGTVTVPLPMPDSPPPPSNNNISSPMAPARNAPPPSSRAAGKQPMAYPPAAPTATATTTNSAPPRSARAAAKAPAPPQSYSNHSHPHHNPSPPVSNASIPQKHRPPGGSGQGSANKSNSKIWSTNTSEERERIKEFWLGLSEKERRQLVEIEKETVLKRMKEQQKHSCTCAVCGRKRNAIEEELEVLYDAYYEELEQYANYQQRYASSGGTLPPPPGPGPFPGSVELDKDGLPVGPGKTHGHSHPPSARVKSANALTNGPKKGIVHESEFDEEDPDAEGYDDEEYDEDEDEEDEEEEDDVDGEDDIEIRNRTGLTARDRDRGGANGKANGRDGIFNFGNSLTVAGPGNILTVADDLLKNDGQKFLEMMEQLAERRMQREEDAARYVEDDSESEEDEEGDDGEDDEDDEDEEDEEDEEGAMTEEQKIAEGKRMFSIFAARMFEQRVLQAYREKVAQERQKQLLQELEEEETAKSQREAKKQKENQKKKDKKRQQKQAKDEERAAKAAERAAEEAAQKDRQRKLEEEQRKKRDEEKAKREAARKMAEEERQKKEEERRKRLAEEKEQQAERERKRKEKEERRKAEQREREERERKAREEREAKFAAERAEKARKEQQEKEERERRLTKEKEEKERVERERQAKEQQQARTAAAKARPPSSPRVGSSASGSRQQQQNAAPKKILNKSSTLPIIPVPAPTPPAQPVRQPSRPTVSTPQHNPPHQQPAASASTAIASPTAATNGPPTPTFPQSTPGVPPQMVSPQRSPFPPQTGVPGYGQFMQPMSVPPPLGPSPMPRPPFGAALPFEAGFGRGLGPAAPIGLPPKVGIPNSLTSPILAPGATVPNRRMSTAADPGPITRPTATVATIAPIARPNGINGDSSGSAPCSSSASPSRRSPSPKRALGSSALAADDDEVVTAPPSRRGVPGPVGQVWHSPRSSVAAPTPWSNAPPGFSPSRATPTSNLSSLGSLGGPWSQAPPPPFPVQGANLTDSWQAHHNTPFFGGSPFMPQNPHSAATPPPHSTGN